MTTQLLPLYLLYYFSNQYYVHITMADTTPTVLLLRLFFFMRGIRTFFYTATLHQNFFCQEEGVGEDIFFGGLGWVRAVNTHPF